MPLDHFAAAGVEVEALSAPAAGPALRRVLDTTLDGVDALIAEAQPLAGAIRRPGMRREAAVIVALAERLAVELRYRDPLAERVELTSGQKLGCVSRGLWRSVTGGKADLARTELEYARHRARGSGSSFYWAMRMLPKAKRAAMFAVYAFCREVDDIADGPETGAARNQALAGWRDEIAALFDGRPRRLIARTLAGPVASYGLRREDFDEIIRGVAMDAGETMRAPDMATLERYCARVAGAVGLLSVRVFGCADPRADAFALSVGHALQLTNILRDVAEDAAVDRLYLPRELLDDAGIRDHDPAAVVAHADLPQACAALAEVARRRYAEAWAMLAEMSADDRSSLRPAVIMMAVYGRLLDRLVGGGWRRLEPPVHLPGVEKLWIALRHCVS